MDQIQMTIKTEVEAAATSAALSDSESDLTCFKQELLQSVKIEPSFADDALLKEEILEDSNQATTMEPMEMTIKTEVEVHFDSEIGLGHLKEEARLLQSVKSESAVSMKEEILDDSTQTGTMEQMELSIKTEVEMAATSAVHSDSAIDLNFIKQEPELLHSVKSEPSCTDEEWLKEEILEDSSLDGTEQQCVHDTSTLARTGHVDETRSTSLGDLCNVKYESAEIEIGTTVLQHMDTHYTINKQKMSTATEENTVVVDFNEAMPDKGVKKENMEGEWRDNKATSHNCDQTTTEVDYEKAQQKDLQKHVLHQRRTSNCNGFKGDGALHAPHLPSAGGELHQRNSRKAAITRGAVASTSAHQSRNKRTETKQKPFVCEVCEKGYSSKAALNLHKRSHSNIELKNHLVNHESHTRRKHFNSDAKFAQSGDLSKNTGDKPYQCVTCDARFVRNGDLIKHVRVHTGEKPYQCKTCDARFAHSSNLAKHVRIHTGEKPYQCKTCDARFARNGDLTQHVRIHTGEKPYQCKICDARFAASGYLTKHVRRHTDERPYHCKICDARFTTNGDLTQHMGVHTGKKRYYKKR